jgi:hypothetical protein
MRLVAACPFERRYAAVALENGHAPPSRQSPALNVVACPLLLDRIPYARPLWAGQQIGRAEDERGWASQPSFLICRSPFVVRRGGHPPMPGQHHDDAARREPCRRLGILRPHRSRNLCFVARNRAGKAPRQKTDGSRPIPMGQARVQDCHVHRVHEHSWNSHAPGERDAADSRVSGYFQAE